MVCAYAEKADRDKPMNIEADKLVHDDSRQRTVFSGKVVATKGTIVFRGDQVEQYWLNTPLPAATVS